MAASKHKSKKCRVCEYRSNDPAVNDCDYAFLMDHSRGCPGGDDCEKFKEGPRLSKRGELLGPVPADEDRGEKDFLQYDYRKHQRMFGYKEALRDYNERKK